MKIKLQLQFDKFVEVEAEPFDFVVQDETFRLAVHKWYGSEALNVTHIGSGKCIGNVDPTDDNIAAARSMLTSLVARHGEARVRSVLAGA